MPRHTSSLQNNLKQARTSAGLTQGELAGQVGISRQAYSSLESGQSTPSTEVAIRLAHRLGGRVESLFYLPEQPPVAIDAELVSGAFCDTSLNSPDQRARIFRVGQKLLARPLSGPENTRHTVVAAEGLIVPTPGAHGLGGVVTVQPFDLDEVDSPTLAMLGCDPAVGLLETGLRAKGVALVAGEESSRQALMGLANGEAHVAGCHLLDDATGTYNSVWVRQLVPFPCTLVTFASWQQGLIIAYGNPKQINGEADLGIGVKAAAVAMGMEFIPIEEERYDLVIPDHFLSETSVQVLLDLLRRPTLHRRVESLGGYDASQMGIQASAN